MTEQPKPLTVENLRPEMKDLLYDTMVNAIHRVALQLVLQHTYNLFRHSCQQGGPRFTVESVWRSLPETTRDHFVNHSLPALDHIEEVLGNGAPRKAEAPDTHVPEPIARMASKAKKKRKK